METGFLNFHDGEHFSTLPSPLYDRDILEDSEGSLLDIMRVDFPYEAPHFAEDNDLWDTEQELNGDMAVLPLSVPLDGSLPKLEPHSKEDFQKMLTEWQEHLGSMQASDTEDMDVKDIVGMDMVMPKHVPEELPDDIFEESSYEMKPSVSPIKQNLENKQKLNLSLSLKEDLSQFSLENFLEGDDEDEDEKCGLTVAEDEAIDIKYDIKIEPKCFPELKSQVDHIDSEDVKPDHKIEVEEDCIDVETVSEQIPVLEAGDLKSLLEQFEASEAFNSNSSNSTGKPSVLDTHLYAMATQQLESAKPKASPPVLSHQNIRDSLPKEVIDRIKASGRKKVIPVIPAMPSKRLGRAGTRMQDAAATLSRNKLLKLVSGGESVQLDHDYCTFNNSPTSDLAAPPRSFYHSDASEYGGDKTSNRLCSSENTEEINGAKSFSNQDKIYSRLPEYYVVLAPQKVLERNRINSRRGSSKEDGWEKNSRKDSGLESGDVSDASEETVGSSSVSSGSCDTLLSTTAITNNRNVKHPSSDNNAKLVSAKVSLATSAKDCSNVVSINGKDINVNSIASTSTISSVTRESVALSQSQANSKVKEMTMVSVLKKCQVGSAVNSNSGQSLLVRSNSMNSESSSNQEVTDVQERPQEPKKRKLNLEEYRSRLKELDRIRSSRDSSRANSPISFPTSPTCVSVGTSVNGDCVDETNDIASVNTANDVAPTAKEDSAEAVKVSSVCASTETEELSTKKIRPEMHSVEVQTQSNIAEETKENQPVETETEMRAGQVRDRRHRQYRSRRASSSSSSGSSSSSSNNSHNSRRRRTESRSVRRQRPSQRRSSGGHSVSSSGSRSRSVWSRSRSNSSQSSSSSCSSSSSRSRSRSRSSGIKSRRSPGRWHSRSSRRAQHSHDYRRRSSNHSGYHGWRRSRSPIRANRKNSGGDWQLTEREKQRQVEERRVIYVGRIDEGTSKAELRRRFELFGPIVDISVHFREHGDNYGFVTFAYKVDAYEAVEHGNDDPNLPHYDLCFGGRRAFCKTRYADLDGMATNNDTLSGSNGFTRSVASTGRGRSQTEDSFDLLLREAQAKLRKRKV